MYGWVALLCTYSPEMITTLLVNQLYPNTKLKVKKKNQNFTLPVQGQQGGMIPTQETKMLHEKKKNKI